LGGDQQLITVLPQVIGKDAAEIGLGRPIWRAVVTLAQCLGGCGPTIIVGEIEVSHAKIERTPDDFALGADRSVEAKVLPKPERDCREINPTLATTTVGHLLIAVWRRNVGHGHAVCHGSRRLAPDGEASWPCPGGTRRERGG